VAVVVAPSISPDNQYTRFDGPGINLWLALSPMSPENGCLMVVPRSHLAGTIDGVQVPTVMDIAPWLTIQRASCYRMNSGDVIAFSRLTLHGSGPNHTDEPRWPTRCNSTVTM
jgi:2-oxoglutarate-dependent dioxygenase